MVKNYKEEEKMDQSKKYPGFFKPFMPQTSSKRLLIPNSFIAHFDKEVPNIAILRNRLGRIWPVKVAKTDDTVCFQNGWDKFVEDNSLLVGEFMTFCYDGEYTFNILLFDKSGCEKENIVPSASSDRRVPFVKIEEVDEDEDEKEEEAIDNDDEEVDDDEEDDDYNDYEAVDDDEEKEEEVDDDNNNCDTYEEDEEEEEKVEAYGGGGQNKDANIRGFHYGATLREKVDKFDKVDVGRYVQPGNPYFMTTLSSGKNNFRQLYVPTEMLTDFAIQLPQKMVFRNKNGREWPGKVVIWKDGRSWIGGWHKFRKQNSLTTEDICICELVKAKPNLVQVHIVRP